MTQSEKHIAAHHDINALRRYLAIPEKDRDGFYWEFDDGNGFVDIECQSALEAMNDAQEHFEESVSDWGEGKYSETYTIGCFDYFHRNLLYCFEYDVSTENDAPSHICLGIDTARMARFQ